MIISSRIRALADDILARDPGPVVTHLLLRDIHLFRHNDPRLIDAQRDLIKSPAIQMLISEQWDDGSWGRLHSKDTSSNQKIPTTEWAVERAIRLGVESSHRILQNGSGYLLSVLKTGQCHDRPEANDRWRTGVNLFAASTLAWITPEHPRIKDTYDLWFNILRATFKSGEYSEKAEIQAHDDHTGASVASSYLRLNNKYAVKLLGSRSSQIPGHLQAAYLEWLRSVPGGLIYLSQLLDLPPAVGQTSAFENWFRSMEILSDFEAFSVVFSDIVQWLWQKRNKEGYWDFGARSKSSPALPLSSTWRKKGARLGDWTTRVLLLLKKSANE